MAVSLAPTRAPEARSHAQPAGARPDGLTVLRSESPSPPLLQLAPSPWVAKLAGLSSPWVALPPLASPASFSSHVYVTEPRESISYLHTQCITVVTRAQRAGWRGQRARKADSWAGFGETAEAHHQRDLSCVPHCSHWKTVASLSTGACLISPPHIPPLLRLLMQLGRNERASSLLSKASESVTLAKAGILALGR